MIVVATEFSETYKSLMQLPQSAIASSALTKDTMLSVNRGLYGAVINLIYVFNNLNYIKRLKLHAHKGKVVFICTPNLLYAVERMLSSLGVEATVEALTHAEVVCAVQQKFLATEQQAIYIANHFKDNFRVIMVNSVAVVQFVHDNVLLPLNYLQYNTSYAEVLLYLCGDPSVEKHVFIQTLHKYRYANKHIIKFIRRVLNLYIQLYFNELTPKQKIGYQEETLILRMIEFLPIERAYLLYEQLESASCKDLLKVVV